DGADDAAARIENGIGVDEHGHTGAVGPLDDHLRISRRAAVAEGAGHRRLLMAESRSARKREFERAAEALLSECWLATPESDRLRIVIGDEARRRFAGVHCGRQIFEETPEIEVDVTAKFRGFFAHLAAIFFQPRCPS